MSDQSDQPPKREPTLLAQAAERLLVGTIEAIARAGAKALESLASDAQRALVTEGSKVERFKDGVAAWRAAKLGDTEDLPESLRGKGYSNGSSNGQEARS